MSLSNQDLRHIVARSSTLFERLTDVFVPDEASTDENLVSKRLDRWCEVVARGDREKFLKRLAWDGLDEETVKPALGAVRLADGQRMPAWAEKLHEMVMVVENTDHTAILNDVYERWVFLEPEKPLPFEEVYIPIIELARGQLKVCLGKAYDLLTESAHGAFERNLLQVLVRVSARVLNLEFSIVRLRAGRYKPVNSALGLTATPTRDIYHSFIAGLLSDKLSDLVRKYPVMARLMAECIDQWLETTGEFIQRLHADYLDLQRTFGINMGNQTDSNQVVAVKPASSDRHNNGRSVNIVTFTSGQMLVYKPKNLEMEEAYITFLSWLNEQRISLPLKLLKVLNKSEYGWVEYISHEPCDDEKAIHRFFYRTGVLLCLLYSLEGRDVHYENLIASSDHPVLVDMETIFYPELHYVDMAQDGAEELAFYQLRDSVLTTGLLPRWILGPEERALDISALGYTGEQDGAFQEPRWAYINTDQMILDYEYRRTKPGENTPVLNHDVKQFNHYRDDIIQGLTDLYEFLMELHEELKDPDGPLAVFSDRPVRFVHRPTRSYYLLQEKTLKPEYLRDGVDRSIGIEQLYNTGATEGDISQPHTLITAECRMMERLDIPYFVTGTSSRDLNIPDGPIIKSFFPYTGYQRVLNRLDTLDTDDMNRQIALVRAACAARFSEDAHDFDHGSEDVEDASSCTTPLLSTEDKLNYAYEIADDLSDRAIISDDGSMVWTGFDYLPGADRYQLNPIGYSLYSGVLGISLFFAALEAISGKDTYRDFAIGPLKPLREILTDSRSDSALAARVGMGIGGGVGLGAICYALIRIGQLIQDDSLIGDALYANTLVSDERIREDKRLDVIGGAAGGILGLLAVFEATSDQSALDRAIACGRHLVMQRTTSHTGHRVWKTVSDIPLTGFAHGTAGIVYALLRLYQHTNDPDLLEAAQEGLAYESVVFLPEAKNWPDFRKMAKPDSPPDLKIQWCHGAPGIGLARLGGLPVVDTPDMQQDIDTALSAIQGHDLQGFDHLCCGGFGRIDILLEAGRRLSRPELCAAGERLAARIINRKDRTHYFRLFEDLTENIYNPGLFQGTSGIGYELLRLIDPKRVPSVLLWE